MTQFKYALVLYTYNQVKDVRRSARSVLTQNCPPIDILFSDDCSSDQTFEILQSETEAYTGPHRVKLNRNERNLGVIEHVHRVFSLTEAEVIINCAGDDLCHPNRAARIIETFEREKPLLACSHAKVEYPDGSPAPRSYKKATFYHPFDTLKAASSLQLYLGATSAWHREIFEKYGPVQFHECFEDVVYGFRAALENRVSVIEEDLLTYKLGTGVTNSVTRPELLSDVKARRELELRRDIAALQQRSLDAKTFGYTQGHPVQRRLNKLISSNKIRLRYVTEGIVSIRSFATLHPFWTYGQILSEKRRWRKALNNQKP